MHGQMARAPWGPPGRVGPRLSVFRVAQPTSRALGPRSSFQARTAWLQPPDGSHRRCQVLPDPLLGAGAAEQAAGRRRQQLRRLGSRRENKVQAAPGARRQRRKLARLHGESVGPQGSPGGQRNRVRPRWRPPPHSRTEGCGALARHLEACTGRGGRRRSFLAPQPGPPRGQPPPRLLTAGRSRALAQAGFRLRSAAFCCPGALHCTCVASSCRRKPSPLPTPHLRSPADAHGRRQRCSQLGGT